MAHFVGFHGYKGGVGRTRALPCVGKILAERGYRVLFLDLDLQAATLESLGWFDKSYIHTSPGLMSAIDCGLDLLGENKSLSRDFEDRLVSAVRPVSLGKKISSLMHPKRSHDQYWIMPTTGNCLDEVRRRIVGTGWESWYLKKDEPGLKLWAATKKIMNAVTIGIGEPPFDIVMVDVAPGYGMLARIGAVQMSDQLISFARQDASLHYATTSRAFADQHHNFHRKQLCQQLVVTHIPESSEPQMLADIGRRFFEQAATIPSVVLPFMTEVMIHGQSSETSPQAVQAAYESIAQLIEAMNPDAPSDRREEAQAAIDVKRQDWRKLILQYMD